MNGAKTNHHSDSLPATYQVMPPLSEAEYAALKPVHSKIGVGRCLVRAFLSIDPPPKPAPRHRHQL